MIDAHLIENEFTNTIFDCYLGIFKKYLIAPLIEGVIGFVLFLSLNFFIKFFGWVTNISSNIQIAGSDFSLALAGFFILFLVKFSVNFSRVNPETDRIAEEIIHEN